MGETLRQWIAKYEAKAEKLIILPGFSIYFEPEKGFFYWKVTYDTTHGKIFEVDHTCTNDGKWAYNKAYEMAKEHGCKWIVTATSRDPAAYMRMYKCQPVLTHSGIRQNGVFYWVFKKLIA